MYGLKIFFTFKILYDDNLGLQALALGLQLWQMPFLTLAFPTNYLLKVYLDIVPCQIEWCLNDL